MKINCQEFKESSFTSISSIKIGDEIIPYEVVSEDNVLYDDTGKAIGSIFSYSYFRSDVENSMNRPVIFAFNGGPGSSSLWLHMGFFGPRRVKIANHIDPQITSPFELEDNPYALLDICDIVLIDPVGTGYGVLIDPEAGGEFFSVENDAKSISLFIENWLIRNNRWNSPKYLAGESYGTIRACVLANTLMGGAISASGRTLGISINGIIMMGSCVKADPHGTCYLESGVETAVLDFPTMAATTYYHKKPATKKALKAFVEEAFHFAETEYLMALFKGNRLGANDKKQLLQKMQYYTGLSKEFIEHNNYRVSLENYATKILKDRSLIVGKYDSRYIMPAANNIGAVDPVADDAAMGKYTPSFSGAMSAVARRELGITLARPYTAINFEINRSWKEDQVKTPHQYLQAALRRNNEMKLLVTNGYFDLATTIGGARYEVSQLNIHQNQIYLREYPSGHMSYLDEDSAKALARDIRMLINKEED